MSLSTAQGPDPRSPQDDPDSALFQSGPSTPEVQRRLRRLGLVSATATVGLSLLYAAVLMVGPATLPAQEQPIDDPWVVLMEGLILLIAPTMAALVIALRAWSPLCRSTSGPIATSSKTPAAVLTSGMHLVLLTGSSRAAAAAAFRWPTTPSALDILAWDLLFGVAALSAGRLLTGGGLAQWAHRLLLASGALALAGLLGVTVDMRLRDIGIVGYAAAAAPLLFILFRRTVAAKLAQR